MDTVQHSQQEFAFFMIVCVVSSSYFEILTGVDLLELVVSAVQLVEASVGVLVVNALSAAEQSVVE